jgi:hypothetical protein
MNRAPNLPEYQARHALPDVGITTGNFEQYADYGAERQPTDAQVRFTGRASLEALHELSPGEHLTGTGESDGTTRRLLVMPNVPLNRYQEDDPMAQYRRRIKLTTERFPDNFATERLGQPRSTIISEKELNAPETIGRLQGVRRLLGRLSTPVVRYRTAAKGVESETSANAGVQDGRIPEADVERTKFRSGIRSFRLMGALRAPQLFDAVSSNYDNPGLHEVMTITDKQRAAAEQARKDALANPSQHAQVRQSLNEQSKQTSNG